MHKRCRHKNNSRLKVKTPFPCTASFFNCTAFLWPFHFYNMDMNEKGYKIRLSVHIYVIRLMLTGN